MKAQLSNVDLYVEEVFKRHADKSLPMDLKTQLASSDTKMEAKRRLKAYLEKNEEKK